MSKPVIPVFYTIDDEYADCAVVSIASLIANANRDYNYNIHVVYQNLNDTSIARLAALSAPGFNIVLNELSEQLDFIQDNSQNRLNNSIFTLSIYFRIFIPEAFPEYDKGIYLDSDTVVPGDISELYNFDLGGNLLGGARDLSIAGIQDFIDYIEQGDKVPFDEYINSGVLLMDMKALRERHLRQSFLEIFTCYHPATVAPDQDYLNTLCRGQIAYFDRAWNCMPTPALAPLAEPKLVHYNLFFKPWRADVDYDDLFWHYAAQAGLESHFRDRRAAFTAEDAAASEAALGGMLAAARNIAQDGSGLGPLFESGKAHIL